MTPRIAILRRPGREVAMKAEAVILSLILSTLQY